MNYNPLLQLKNENYHFYNLNFVEFLLESFFKQLFSFHKLMYSSKKFFIPFSFGVLGLIFISLSKIIESISGSKSYEIAWLASFFIMVGMLCIRFYSLDTNKFTSIINTTNPLQESDLQPIRFANGMTLAMIIGFFATVSIYFNFIVGMLVYLAMHLCLIYAFSGITTLNPSILLKNDKFKFFTIFTFFFWIAIISVVYFVFVFDGAESIIVIPYVIALGTMAHYSWYGLPYIDRSKMFRFMIFFASGIFVFSDSLIGNSRFGTFKLDFLFFLIDITYVINIFLMSQSILFLKDKNGTSPLK